MSAQAWKSRSHEKMRRTGSEYDLESAIEVALTALEDLLVHVWAKKRAVRIW